MAIRIRFDAFNHLVKAGTLLALSLGWAFSGETRHAEPTASRSIPVALGSVDAVSGQMNLRVPLSPKLPGRIPVGFLWYLDSQAQDAPYTYLGGVYPNTSLLTDRIPLGGGFRVVDWDGANKGKQATVLVEGQPIAFYKVTTPATAAPSEATLIAWARERGVGLVQADPNDPETFNPILVSLKTSSDGTRFLVTFRNVTGYVNNKPVGPLVSVILQGDLAIWRRASAPTITYFTNRFGDRVRVQEYTTSDTGHVGRDGTPYKIEVVNELAPAPGHKLTLNVEELAPRIREEVYTRQVKVRVTTTNTLGLPGFRLQGELADAQVYIAPPAAPSTLYRSGVRSLESVEMVSSEGTIRPYFTAVDTGTTWALTFANGLKETYTFGYQYRPATTAFDPTTGNFIGYQFPANPGPSTEPPEHLWEESQCVTRITREDGTGAGNVTVLARSSLDVKLDGGRWVLAPGPMVTSILTYGSPNPEPGALYRGVRLIHPSSYTGFVGDTTTRGYITMTQAVVGIESITGTEADAKGHPIKPTVHQTVRFDGWDLRSWANPTGALSNILPVVPVPLRTRSASYDEPCKEVLAGLYSWPLGRDAWGPIQTKEYTSAPVAAGTVLPTADPTVAPIWASSLTDGSGILVRTGKITRTWNATRMTLEVQSDKKDLAGTGLASLRNQASALPTLTGASSVDFGTTGFTYDTATGLPGVITGTTGTAVATETRTYGVLGSNGQALPLLTRTEKALTVGGTAVLAKPGDPSVKVGSAFTYDATPFQWLASETDLVDGRPTTFVRDGLGREVSRTSPLGITTTTSYDAWGRVSAVVRQARGSVGAVSTTYDYDPNGLWKDVTVSGEGRTLRTRTTLDAFGRMVRVETFGPTGRLTVQTSTYDGFGQLVAQSPVLREGQAAYGDTTFQYDARGRLVKTLDVKGRTVSEVLQFPKYEAKTFEGVTLTAFWTQVKDAHGYSRWTATDLLGQRVALFEVLNPVDQSGNLTRYFYDENGRLAKTQQGTQARWYKYDALGRLLTRFEPEEGRTEFSNFTLLGSALTATQKGRNGADAWTTTTTLNAWLLPMSVTSTGPENTVVVRNYAYRPDHLLDRLIESQAEGILSETYGYDDLFRLNTKSVSDGHLDSNPLTFTVSRVLDAFGNVTTETLPAAGGRAAQTISRTLDAEGRPSQVTLGGQSRGLMGYPAPSGNAVETLLTFGNGVTTRQRMEAGELVRTEHGVRDGNGLLPNNLERNDLSWSAGGLLLTRGGDAFIYDALRRLTQATTVGLLDGETTTQTFTYDRYGNRTASAHTYSLTSLERPKELVAWSYTSTGSNDLPSTVTIPGGSVATHVAYDNLGRITGVDAIPGKTDSYTTWGYDALGRVRQETYQGATQTYLLDAEGLRFKRVAGTTTTYTVYGFNREPVMVLEKVGAGALTWKKTLVHGLGQLLSEEKPTGTFYVQGDQVGSPNLITDANGKVVGRTKNLPFGERYERDGGGLGTERSTRRYTNHEDQPGSAIYMQARTYLPVYGKFAQMDPAYDQVKSDPESWNLYGYCGNNPVTNTDPDGRQWMTPGPISGAAQAFWRDSPAWIERKDFNLVAFIQLAINQGQFKAEEGQAPAPRDLVVSGQVIQATSYELVTYHPNQPAQTNLTGQQGQGLSGPPGSLDPLQQATKDAAIKAGEVSGQKFGKLNVFVYGGTVQERTAVLAALTDVFTKSAHGGTELQALEARKTWLGMGSVKPFDIMLAPNKAGSYTYEGSQGMVLDLRQVGAGARLFANPGGGFSLQRIIAHELGHAAMGVDDAGPRRMDNVIRNENRIMRELGDTNDRVIYN